MKTLLLSGLIILCNAVNSQSEKSILKSVYKKIEYYEHHKMQMEEWFKFQSDVDTQYSNIESEIYRFLNIPAYSFSKKTDQYDTVYQVATVLEYTALNKKQDIYTHFTKKTHKNIMYYEYINRIMYNPFQLKWHDLKKYKLLSDSADLFVLGYSTIIGDQLDTVTFVYRLYVNKTDFMPIAYEDWAYFEGGVQYCKQKLNKVEPLDKKGRNDFILKLDSTSKAFCTHINGDSLQKIRFSQYRKFQLGDTMRPISGRISSSKDSFNLFKHGDSILILDFSYTNCGPCVMSIPALKNLHDKFDSLGVAVYWLDPYKNDWPRLEKFSNYYKINYPIVEVDYNYTYDYNVIGFPRLFVIKNGILIYYHSGYSEDIEKEVTKVVEKALGRRS